MFNVDRAVELAVSFRTCGEGAAEAAVQYKYLLFCVTFIQLPQHPLRFNSGGSQEITASV
jgi:hypothetical protein